MKDIFILFDVRKENDDSQKICSYRAFQNKLTHYILLCRTQLLFKLKDIYTEYPSNTQVCIPKKYLADFGRSASFFDFSIFFFFRNFCGIAFFSGKNFLANFLDTQKVSKHQNFFLDNNTTLKSCLTKKI